eukprot:CAMPEP_0115834244 /NCGR_PEP_ID=MMETSP0287-20121206/3584_1 /TAXON_ID=412157 /ORGANISM="Chrysochromulina rotalis, Strain UIO044" /LENGTH=321 /DNA_ID=CAMNT_0003287675 /DNA_START=256 /DNA_END=1221 /DNA_ORIENTATION=+
MGALFCAQARRPAAEGMELHPRPNGGEEVSEGSWSTAPGHGRPPRVSNMQRGALPSKPRVTCDSTAVGHTKDVCVAPTSLLRSRLMRAGPSKSVRTCFPGHTGNGKTSPQEPARQDILRRQLDEVGSIRYLQDSTLLLSSNSQSDREISKAIDADGGSSAPDLCTEEAPMMKIGHEAVAARANTVGAEGLKGTSLAPGIFVQPETSTRSEKLQALRLASREGSGGANTAFSWVVLEADGRRTRREPQAHVVPESLTLATRGMAQASAVTDTVIDVAFAANGTLEVATSQRMEQGFNIVGSLWTRTSSQMRSLTRNSTGPHR